MGTDKDAERSIIRTFQERRRRAGRMAGPGFFGFVFLLLAGVALYHLAGGSPSLSARCCWAGGVVSLVFGIITLSIIYRCPGCGKIPMTSGGRGQVVDLDPARCRKCGARLREEDRSSG